MSTPVKRIVATQITGGPGKPNTWSVKTDDSDVRLVLAVGFSVLFALTTGAALIMPFVIGKDPKTTWDIVKDILSVLLPAQTGLLGSILGFYFGSKAAGESKNPQNGDDGTDDDPTDDDVDAGRGGRP